MLFGGLLVAAILLATKASAQEEPVSQDPATPNQSAGVSEEAAPLAPFLSYQGQLLDPFTSQPKPNGDYAMTFAIYNAPTGGAPLWQEAKVVTASGGYIATLLGNVIPFDLSIFNGQVLYLGIKVNNDPETTPRQLLAYAPYALYAGNADTLDGLDSSAFARVGQSGFSPIAYGLVDKDGNRINGSNNWSSQYVDHGGNQKGYEVQINGEDFNYRNYVLSVTANCGDIQNESLMINTGSTNGKMLVEFLDPAAQRERCGFNFLVFKP
jgi:hypothetical protein